MSDQKPCLPGCTDMIGPLCVGVDHTWECPNHSRFANPKCSPECPTIRQSGMPKHSPGCPNAAPKASEAPVEGYQPGRTKLGNLQPAPAPEPDPLKGIDAQKWAKEFMRIWSGRWSEVDEGLMIGWFANAIMRGFDEGQRRLRKQHGCELPPLAEPKPSAPPAPEPMTTLGAALAKACPEPKQGSEEPITDHALECWHGIYTMSHNEAKWFNEACYARITALRAELAQARDEIAVRDASISDWARQAAELREDLYKEAHENVKLAAKWGDGSAWIPETVLAAERAARERAESRVKELENRILKWYGNETGCGHSCTCGFGCSHLNGCLTECGCPDASEGAVELLEEADAILARAKEESK